MKTKKELIEWMKAHLQSGTYYVVKYSGLWFYCSKPYTDGTKMYTVKVNGKTMLCD